MNSILAVIISYALGSFLTGYYLVKFKTGRDIRTFESGSAGATNVGRVLGTYGFIITFVGDTLKGIFALLISLNLRVELWVLMASVLATVAGHIWPFQLKLRGGKGLSPALGAVLIFDYRIALGYFAVALLIYVLIRRLDVSGLIALVSLPFVTYLLGYPPTIIIGMFLLLCLILFAHRSNIAKLTSRRI